MGGRSRDLPTCDYVLIVFDKDTDKYVEEIVQQLWNETDAETFVSSPCFEYFFCLHFSMIRPSANSLSDLLPIVRNLEGFGNYSKKTDAVPIALLSTKQTEAVENAAKSRKDCYDEGSNGPYTEIDLLFEAVTIAKSRGLESLRDSLALRNERRHQNH